MDALNEINAAIEGLCTIAERARAAVLADLITEAHVSVEYGPANEAGVAALAMQYAEWSRSLDGYRALLRRRQSDVRVVR